MMVATHAAENPNVDATKLGHILELQRQLRRDMAKEAFEQAFVEMQPNLPTINKNGRIMNKDGKTLRSRYARYGEDIQLAVMPIIAKYGFSLRHSTVFTPTANGDDITVTGILTHIKGHSEPSTFTAKADKNEFRTALQDRGSTVSFAKRYTTVDLLNLRQIGVDDDGQSADSSRKTGDETKPHTSNPGDNRPITTRWKDDKGKEHAGQLERLWAIIKKSGRKEDEIKAWLAVAYGIDHTKDIKRKDYDAICTAIEAKGPLPAPRSEARDADEILPPEGDREPGSDG